MEKRSAMPGQYLTFSLNAQTYGIPIATVREINRVLDITPVPQTPDYVAGIINLRGKIIPVINLRKRLGFTIQDYTKQTCIVVIDCPTGQVGAIVDTVSSVSDFAANQIEPAPELSGDIARYILGVGKLDKSVIILLDIVGSITADVAQLDLTKVQVDASAAA